MPSVEREREKGRKSANEWKKRGIKDGVTETDRERSRGREGSGETRRETNTSVSDNASVLIKGINGRGGGEVAFTSAKFINSP